MAVAITLVDLEQGQVLDALQPRRELPRPLTFSEAINATLGIDDFAWGTGLAQLDGIGRWTVVIEPNGWRCSVPDELAAMFASATAMNVFWNVNSVMSCCLVREGVVVRAFDGLLYESPAEPLAEERGFDWGVSAPRASMLGLMERVTGVRIEPEWLFDSPRRTFEIPLPVTPVEHAEASSRN